MLAFFRNLLATVIGLFIFFFFFFIILIGIGASAGEKEVSIDDQSILHLTLASEIVESAPPNPFQDLNLPFPGGVAAGKLGLRQIKENIRKAAKDEKIEGIFLDISILIAGYATVEELRNELIKFKQSGKFIIAYSEVMSEKAYYLASVSDQIYLYPSGGMEMNGLSTEITFFKGLFDKLNVQPEVFKVGDFKSAVEPFIREDMSEPNRIQVTSFLNSLNDFQLKQIGSTLNKPYEELKMISDSMFVRDAEDAVKYGLISKLAYYDEVLSEFRNRLELDSEDDKINFVGLSKYSKIPNGESSYGKDKVAVIIAEGDIVSGKSDEESMGSETIASEIRKARLDDKVKAVVLRVNSPGGSALASDVMWREVMLCKKVKPVIASMSDVAASGGYYISMACDTIVAYPNTITGSIGVFGMWFNIGQFMKDKMGITTDRVRTGHFSDLGSMTREITDYERAEIQRQVEKTYEEFTTKAARGRGMTVEELKKVASGRVWTGMEAKEVGLVDVLGGIDDAIDIAARSAKLDSNYAVRYYPEQKDFFEKLVEDLGGEVRAMVMPQDFTEWMRYKDEISKLDRLKGIQTRTYINAKRVE